MCRWPARRSPRGATSTSRSRRCRRWRTIGACWRRPRPPTGPCRSDSRPVAAPESTPCASSCAAAPSARSNRCGSTARGPATAPTTSAPPGPAGAGWRADEWPTAWPPIHWPTASTPDWSSPASTGSRTSPPSPPTCAALTTTAPVQRPPWVEISGPGGTWRLSYTEDLSWRTGPDGELTEHRHSRTDLVENLLTHVRDPQTALLSPLEASGAFSAVLEAIQSAPDPTVIDPEHVTWIGEGQAAHPVVDDIGDALHTALETGTAFSRNGVSWACADAITTWRPPGANQTPTARADGRGATQKETA